MTTHSSILSWRIPWTEEPGGLQSGVAELDATEHKACTVNSDLGEFTISAVMKRLVPYFQLHTLSDVLYASL